MKGRPRRVENRVAEELTLFSSQFGYSEIVRLPVIGRTGPDISINGLNLAVDVKSRKQVPKLMFSYDGEVWLFNNGLMSVRLDEINLLLGDIDTDKLRYWRGSKMALDWMMHMEDWCLMQEYPPIPALVLHRPGMNIKDSAFVIYSRHRRSLDGRCRK